MIWIWKPCVITWFMKIRWPLNSPSLTIFIQHDAIGLPVFLVSVSSSLSIATS